MCSEWSFCCIWCEWGFWKLFHQFEVFEVFFFFFFFFFFFYKSWFMFFVLFFSLVILWIQQFLNQVGFNKENQLYFNSWNKRPDETYQTTCLCKLVIIGCAFWWTLDWQSETIMYYIFFWCFHHFFFQVWKRERGGRGTFTKRFFTIWKY